MRADGSHRRRLGARATCETDPAWSSDGRKILFASVCERFSPRLYTMAPDGRGLRRLPITGFAPAWSPQGDRLAYLLRPKNSSWLPMSQHLEGQRGLRMASRSPSRAPSRATALCTSNHTSTSLIATERAKAGFFSPLAGVTLPRIGGASSGFRSRNDRSANPDRLQAYGAVQVPTAAVDDAQEMATGAQSDRPVDTASETSRRASDPAPAATAADLEREDPPVGCHGWSARAQVDGELDTPQRAVRPCQASGASA